MTRKDMVTMSQEELRRLHVMHKVMEKVMTQADGAVKVELCERQVRRIIARIREDGDSGIIHRLRGKTSNRAMPEKVKNKVLELFRDKYGDFGPTLASEKLFERDKIKINDETLRCWLIERGIPYKRRKKRPHRQWRERKRHYGEMIQMDGSHHDWFEGRGEPCVLMGYIDDATGKPFARFYAYEGTVPAMDSFKGYIKKHGVPLSVYLDKHTTYKSTGKPSIEDELNDTGPLSQFERALGELGVEVIHANSPQAKGRIERLFGTFQDRLIKEMRLRKISNIEQGNEFLEKYLPVYAKQFSVTAARAGDLHRPVPRGVVLNDILCVKTERVLRNDLTVVHNRQLYQIVDNIRAKKVIVREKINGSMSILYKGRTLKFKLIALRPQKQNEALKPVETSSKRTYTPALDHPWRQCKFGQNSNAYSQEESLVAQV